jgi:glycosyltransferase involved in cell wall biosynthesis
MYRLALVASHPIQYYVPWYRALSDVCDLEVFYCHQQDGVGQAAAGFGVAFDWDVPLLDGYSHTFLRNVASKPDVSRFFGCDTPELADRLRAGRFDACIVSGWYLKSYVQAIRACKRSRIPVLMRGDSQLGTARSRAWMMAKYWPYRWWLRSLDAHLFVGAANRDYLKYYGVEDGRLFFTPHFVDNAFFQTRALAARANGQAAAIRRRLGIPADAIVFAFAGKLIEKKRPADLIRALAAARATDRQLWGLIIGSGPLQHDLDQLTRSLDAPVAFAGFQNQTDMPRHLAAADALVLPSDGRETWGLVVNEAMACDLPAIVSSAVGCARDLVDDTTGAQYAVGDPSALRSAIISIAHVLRTQTAAVHRNVRAKIAQYSCEATLKGTMTALDAVIGRSAARTQSSVPLRHTRVS